MLSLVLIIGNTQYLARGFEGSSYSIDDLSTAFYGGLWSYDGWYVSIPFHLKMCFISLKHFRLFRNNLNFITEELKNPYVTLPRAIIIGIPLVIVCYLAVNVAYLTVLSPESIISSAAVAVVRHPITTLSNALLSEAKFHIEQDVGDKVLGRAGFIIPIAVAMSVLGGILSNTFTAGRSVPSSFQTQSLQL